MQNPTRGVLHQHEDIEETKGRRDHCAETQATMALAWLWINVVLPENSYP
jgi:hypothetical protein